MIRRDCTPKPAYDELLGLVKGEWWVAPQTVRTDGDGRVGLRGFLGEYEVSRVDDPVSARFTLDSPGETSLQVRRPS